MNPLRWYLVSTGALLVPGGIQMVLFPWLIAVYLQESAERVGIAQMAGMLPGLVLILVGGVVGDRVDQVRILRNAHLLAAVPALGLALLIGSENISYGLILGYAILGGIIGSIAQPARDALLSRVAGEDIQRTVTMVIGLQFGIQIIGFGFGGLADRVGPVPLLTMQAVLMALGAAAVTRMRLPARPARRSEQHALRQIVDGVRYTLSSSRIRPAIALYCAVGLFFAGTYMVWLPLMVRDFYHGSAWGISLAFASNMAGTVVTTSVLVWRGGIRRQGRALIVASFLSCLVLLVLSRGLPYPLFFTATFLWGICGGVSMTMSRTIVQEASPPEYLARIMSVFSLGLMGGMPLGSLMMGYLIGAWGPLNAALVPVGGVALTMLLITLLTDLWRQTPGPVPATVESNQVS